MEKITKIYIGNKGFTGKTVHAVRVEEDTNGHIYLGNGTTNNLCNNWETTVRPITNVRKVIATKENVTCKNCLKRL